MVQFFADCIDQLDLALDQLTLADRNFDRFALMLIDNVVELALHRYAKDRASENARWDRLSKPKYDPKLVSKALGLFFDDKAKAACQLGLMSADVRDSILHLHTYRNSAYHIGLRHEGILHSLAVFYFRNACEILHAYKPMWWSGSSQDTLSHRARKYIGNPSLHQPEKVFGAAFTRLDEVAASMDANLIADLSLDMAQTIDSIDNAIEFLATDAPEKSSRDEAIIACQAWSFAFTDEANEFARKGGCAEQSVGGYVDWLAKSYKWPIRSDPVPSWRKRLQSLRGTQDQHKGLKRYCDFMQQTEDIRSKINNSAAALDAHNEHRMDMMRGK